MRRSLPTLLSLVVLAGPLPAPAQTAAARTIEIQASDNLRFTPARIDARPGERLRVVLKDAGTLPKNAMAHNWVLLKKGADAKAFVAKSATAGDTSYIAPAVKDQVLASTTLVGPGETAEVTFTVPQQTGEYTFVCSFPGHFVVDVKGTLIVAPQDMPRLDRRR